MVYNNDNDAMTLMFKKTKNSKVELCSNLKVVNIEGRKNVIDTLQTFCQGGGGYLTEKITMRLSLARFMSPKPVVYGWQP